MTGLGPEPLLKISSKTAFELLFLKTNLKPLLTKRVP